MSTRPCLGQCRSVIEDGVSGVDGTGGVGGLGPVGQLGGERPWWWGEPPGGEEGAGGGRGGGDLEHSDGPWLRAAGGTEGLVAHFGPVEAELERAHAGLMAGAGELSALAELGAVRASWERRIETARDECRSLAGKLRAVAVTQSTVNEVVKGAFDGVRVAGGGAGPGAEAGAGVGPGSGRGEER
ncbi:MULTISPECIES: hypothetical protein [unclassified Streptomyces]|uniref:hypothetical protein n=1 Tax=unclassified Streptomyces TaxID=2593676 RepID=UPI000C06ABBB|nr:MULTISPECIES: hypothetical protein [unclassified Streptomyces]MYT97251.1 hypothetical protein [Streptomyces sp. SID8350]